MCLHQVSKRFPKNDRVKIGYKVFCRVISDSVYNYCYHNPHFEMKILRPLGKSYHIPDRVERKLGAGVGIEYDSGYHIYSNKQDAIDSMSYESPPAVCEVIAWDIRAYGKQNRKKVFVSRNYRIMREVR